MTSLRQIWAIVAKDLTAELHTKEMVSAMGLFGVLSVLIFSFSLDLSGSVARASAPGVLWVTVTFAGILGLNRSLSREGQHGGLDGLMLAPMDRSTIFAGKALGNLLFMLAVEAVLLPLVSALFGVHLVRGGVILILFLGTLGYAGVGTLLAAIALNTRAQAVALPVLMLPLVVPVLVGAVRATGGLIEGATLGEVGTWTRLLVTYDLVLLAIALLTFGYVVEE